jgi:hypothetical protein
MDEINGTSAEPAKKHKSRMLLVLALLIVVVGVGAGYYLYRSQRDQADSLTGKNASLSMQLSTLKTQVNAAKAAGNVTTSNWKAYCDPHGIFCFKYPSGWTVDSGYSSEVQADSVTLTNPSKTLTAYFLDNYTKDGFAGNFIVHSIKALNVGSNNLALLGGYYIQTVGYTPQYEVTSIDNDTNGVSLSDKIGQNIFAPVPPGFDYSDGVYNTSIGQFYIEPTSKIFSTLQQANAWYGSVDGKTAYLIASSLSAKQ